MKDNILNNICSELVRVMGPIAPVVMADKIKSLGAADRDFPTEKVAELVEIISYEIQDEDSRAEFQKGALDQLKHFETHAGA